MNKIHTLYFALVISTITLFSGCVTNPATSSGSGILINHDRRTIGTFVDDQTIAMKATLALVKEKELWKKSHISTLSYNNVLLLVGQTPVASLKHDAQKALEDIPGIESIYNQITIQEPITLSTRAKDTWITAQLKAKLITSRDIGPSRVKVITEDGIIYLMGILTKDEENIATDIASRIQGVVNVVKVFERFENLDS
jgi:osmotically-inducible protein OsmY